MSLPCLSHPLSVSLRYTGDCSLLGVTSDLTVYVEESYTEYCWIAQHAIRPDGTIQQSADEQHGLRPGALLTLPADLTRPDARAAALRRNFTGPRLRGLREPERVTEMVRPLTVMDKLRLAETLRLTFPAPLLLGVAEDVVLAGARLTATTTLLCRRVRLAYALPQPQRDTDGTPYDYDTLTYHTAQLHDQAVDDDDAPPPPGLTTALDAPGEPVLRPLDCLVAHGHLFIADAGDEAAGRVSRLHRWRLTQAVG